MINSERLINNFLELVKIDSVTFEEKAVVDFVMSALDKARSRGVAIEVDDAGEKIGGQTGNLVVTIPGNPASPTLMFNAHLDTVEPGRGVLPEINGGRIKSVGGTILGADDKVGVAVLMELAFSLFERNGKHCPVKLVFTVAEEKGLLGAKHLDKNLIAADQVFVFDSVGPVGEITVRAPFQNSIYAEFIGKAAHSGLNPEAGINSIKAAALAVSKMRLGRIDDETTANIGVIEGGSAINIVPARTEIKGEARSLSETKLTAQTDEMVDAIEEAGDQVGTELDFKVVREYNGFNIDGNAGVVKTATEAIKRIGLNPTLRSTGGGSDTNVFNAKGVESIGLGVGYVNPHTTEENVSITEMEKAARLAVAIVDMVSSP